MTRLLMLTAGLLLLSASASFAQASRPPVELGLGLSSLSADPYEDIGIQEQPLAADFRITMPVSPRVSVEALMTLSRRTDAYRSGVDGFYMIQVKQQLASATRGGFHPFLTYGALGYHERGHVKPYSIALPSGTITTFPESSFSSVSPPYGFVAGAGVQHQLGKHVALRAEGQMITFLWIPLGARFSAQLSIPFGSYSRN